jgi:hypothetical protein
MGVLARKETEEEEVVAHRCSPRYTFLTMTPKLRTIRTTRRVGSVSRKEIRAAVKAVMAERDPETDLLIRGITSRKKVAGAARK